MGDCVWSPVRETDIKHDWKSRNVSHFLRVEVLWNILSISAYCNSWYLTFYSLERMAHVSLNHARTYLYSIYHHDHWITAPFINSNYDSILCSIILIKIIHKLLRSDSYLVVCRESNSSRTSFVCDEQEGWYNQLYQRQNCGLQRAGIKSSFNWKEAEYIKMCSTSRHNCHEVEARDDRIPNVMMQKSPNASSSRIGKTVNDTDQQNLTFKKFKDSIMPFRIILG